MSIFSVSPIVAVLIGWLAASTDWGLALAIAVPPLSFVQRTRRRATIVAAGYYGGASYLVIGASRAFFGPHVTIAEAVGLWAVATVLLATPYTILWAGDRAGVAWRIPAAVLASVAPPLGIIGWASPLTAAGFLFPGTGWAGIALALFGPVALSIRPKLAVPCLLAISFLAHALFPDAPVAPPGWVGLDTKFGGAGLNRSSPLAEFLAMREIQSRIRCATATVVVLPETVVATWTPATDLLWRPFLAEMGASGRTLIIGTLIFDSDGRRQNGLIIRGTTAGTFRQRMPVPIGMWRPGSAESAAVSPFAATTLAVGGETVAPIICYEQFLTWPILTAAIHKPAILVAPSNAYWAHGTQVTARQRALMTAWARLFRVNLASAVNE